MKYKNKYEDILLYKWDLVTLHELYHFELKDPRRGVQEEEKLVLII